MSRHNYHASGYLNEGSDDSETRINTSVNAMASSSYQGNYGSVESSTADHVIDSAISASSGDYYNELYGEDLQEEDIQEEDIQDDMGVGADSHGEEQASVEQLQKTYYERGIKLLENLQLLDLSPLANWKLSSFKQEYGLSQLRADSANAYWQSDGSNGPNSQSNNNNNQLANPHSITIQFSKKVSLERISIFTNYSADESYTPSKIQILAGNSDSWDLSEVCVVNFNKPIGWSHIIFNAIRKDGVLKCFVVKIVILANHQDGKDTRIRAIRCYGKKNAATKLKSWAGTSTSSDILKDLSISGLESHNSTHINHLDSFNYSEDCFYDEQQDLPIQKGLAEESANSNPIDKETSKILDNVAQVIAFNSGFRSLNLSSVSSIR